jgi:hypothetical protein
MATAKTFSQLLAEYREAVRQTLFWETRGNYGDGNNVASKAAERAARTALTRYVSNAVKSP